MKETSPVEKSFNDWQKSDSSFLLQAITRDYPSKLITALFFSLSFETGLLICCYYCVALNSELLLLLCECKPKLELSQLQNPDFSNPFGAPLPYLISSVSSHDWSTSLFLFVNWRLIGPFNFIKHLSAIWDLQILHVSDFPDIPDRKEIETFRRNSRGNSEKYFVSAWIRCLVALLVRGTLVSWTLVIEFLNSRCC